jgi:peptidoglycan/xylan/chitin deacetylase (PgdA/CDA1 family)
MSPHLPSWPGGARVAAAVTVHVDGPSVEVGQGLLPLGIHSAGRYCIQRGVHRYLDMLARRGIAATFFACGWDVEHWPQLFREIHAAGHEIAAHGYLHEAWELGAQEPALLRKTHELIADTVGEAPVGWCSPSGRKSALTIPTLRALGYLYDASEKDADAPYMLETPEGIANDFVILPNNTVSLDDAPMYRIGQALAGEVYDNWVQEFEAIRENEGYLHLTVHPKAHVGSGTPGRAAVVDRFLRTLGDSGDVVFMTLREMACHCIAQPRAWRRPGVIAAQAAA